ncbi:hypothetical protein RCL1_002249 [Eukaryota sp. TZLM3-RCL]
MTTKEVVPLFAWGVNSSVENGIAFLDDENIVYCVGKRLVSLHIDSKEQFFFSDDENRLSRSITPTILSCSPLSGFIALAETLERNIHSVSIFSFSDRSKVKTILLSDLQISSPVVSLSLSTDGQYLCFVCGDPCYSLVLLHWDTNKILVQHRPNKPFRHCSFVPFHDDLLAVSGNGVFKFFKLSEGSLRPLHLFNERQASELNFTSHQWVYSISKSKSSNISKKSVSYLCLGTDIGDTFIFSGDLEHVTTLLGSFSAESAQLIVSICGNLNNLFICSSGGVISWYERVFNEKNEPNFQLRDLVKFSIDAGFTAISCNSTAAVLVGSTVDSQILTLSASSLLSYTSSDENLEIIQSTLAIGDLPLALPTLPSPGPATKTPPIPPKVGFFSYLVSSFPSSSILSIDTCSTRPLFIVSSSDQCIRVFNWAKKVCEVATKFPASCTALSCHPDGLYIIAAFPDILRLLSVTLTSLVTVTEFPIAGVSAVSVSHGGNLFAVATSGDHNVYLYSFWTSKPVACVRLHLSPVTSLSWSSDDLSISTVGLDGAVYVWDLTSLDHSSDVLPVPSRLAESVVRDCQGNSVSLSETINQTDNTSLIEVVSSSNDGRLRILSLSRQLKSFNQKKSSTSTSSFSLSDYSTSFLAFSNPPKCLHLSSENEFLIMGTSNGTLSLLKWPIKSEDQKGALKSSRSSSNLIDCLADGLISTIKPLHSSDTTTLSVIGSRGLLGLDSNSSTSLGSFGLASVSRHPFLVISGSSDGSLFISTILSDLESIPNLSDFCGYIGDDRLLITRDELEENLQSVNSLKRIIKEKESDFKTEMTVLKGDYERKMKELSDKYHSIKNDSSLEVGQLKDTLKSKILEYGEELKLKEINQSKEIAKMKAHYDEVIGEKRLFIEQLKEEIEEQKENFQHEFSKISDKHELALKSTRDQFSDREQYFLDQIEALKDENKQLAHANSEETKQILEDHDLEIVLAENRYRKKVADLEEKNLLLKNQVTQYEKKFLAFTEEISSRDTEVQRREGEIQSLKKSNAEVLRRVTMLKQEIEERDVTIAEKERRLYELNQKNQHLEKFKYVLGVKMRDLKAQIQPRDDQLTQMKEHIESMDRQLEVDQQNSVMLEVANKEQNLRIKTLSSEVSKLKTKLSDKERMIGLLISDLGRVVSQDDPRQWKDSIRQMYSQYCNKNVSDTSEVPVDSTVSEVVRHRTHLEHSISTLSKSLDQISEISKQDKVQKIHENSVLLSELNELRRVNLTLQREKHSLLSQIKQLKLQQSSTRNRSNSPPKSLIEPETTRKSVTPTPLSATPGSGRQMFTYSNRRSQSGVLFKGRPSDHFQLVNDSARAEMLEKELTSRNVLIEDLSAQISKLKQTINTMARNIPDDVNS